MIQMTKLAELYLNFAHDNVDLHHILSIHYDPENDLYVCSNAYILLDDYYCSNEPVVCKTPYQALSSIEYGINSYFEVVCTDGDFKEIDIPFKKDRIEVNDGFFNNQYRGESNIYAEASFPDENIDQLFMPFDVKSKVIEIWSRLVKKYFPGKEE